MFTHAKALPFPPHTFLSAFAQDVCSPGNSLPTPISVVLPSNEAELEALEGMLVSIRNPVVTDNYNADSYGEVTVAAERRWQYTQVSLSLWNL